MKTIYTCTTRVVSIAFFFFSSRRRHTRSDRDWSSDVCSSDLHLPQRHAQGERRLGEHAVSNRARPRDPRRSEEHTSELQSRSDLVCRLLLEKKKKLQTAHLLLSHTL